MALDSRLFSSTSDSSRLKKGEELQKIQNDAKKLLQGSLPFHSDTMVLARQIFRQKQSYLLKAD